MIHPLSESFAMVTVSVIALIELIILGGFFLQRCKNKQKPKFFDTIADGIPCYAVAESDKLSKFRDNPTAGFIFVDIRSGPKR